VPRRWRLQPTAARSCSRRRFTYKGSKLIDQGNAGLARHSTVISGWSDWCFEPDHHEETSRTSDDSKSSSTGLGPFSCSRTHSRREPDPALADRSQASPYGYFNGTLANSLIPSGTTHRRRATGRTCNPQGPIGQQVEGDTIQRSSRRSRTQLRRSPRSTCPSSRSSSGRVVDLQHEYFHASLAENSTRPDLLHVPDNLLSFTASARRQSG